MEFGNDLSMESRNMEFATLSTIRLDAWIDGVVGVASDGITGVCGGHLVKVVGTTTLSSA